MKLSKNDADLSPIEAFVQLENNKAFKLVRLVPLCLCLYLCFCLFVVRCPIIVCAAHLLPLSSYVSFPLVFCDMLFFVEVWYFCSYLFLFIPNLNSDFPFLHFSWLVYVAGWCFGFVTWRVERIRSAHASNQARWWRVAVWKSTVEVRGFLPFFLVEKVFIINVFMQISIFLVPFASFGLDRCVLCLLDLTCVDGKKNGIMALKNLHTLSIKFDFLFSFFFFFFWLFVNRKRRFVLHACLCAFVVCFSFRFFIHVVFSFCVVLFWLGVASFSCAPCVARSCRKGYSAHWAGPEIRPYFLTSYFLECITTTNSTCKFVWHFVLRFLSAFPFDLIWIEPIWLADLFSFLSVLFAHVFCCRLCVNVCSFTIASKPIDSLKLVVTWSDLLLPSTTPRECRLSVEGMRLQGEFFAFLFVFESFFLLNYSFACTSVCIVCFLSFANLFEC